MATRIRIDCGWIVSVDPDIGEIKDGSIIIEDDKIIAIEKDQSAEAEEIIDAKHMIASPGLINAHIHTWQTALRAIGSDWVSGDYHKNMHSNIATMYSAEDMYLGNLFGGLRQIDNGVTTIFDWCHGLRDIEMTDRAVDGIEESGIRAVFGHGTAKPPIKEGELPFTHVPHPMDRVDHLRNGRLHDDDGLVTLALAILGPDFGAYDVAIKDLQLAKELDILSTTHVWHGFSRNVPEDAHIKDAYIKLGEMGLLSPKHNIVHGNYLPEDQIRYVLDKGCTITSTVLCEIHGHGAYPLVGIVRNHGSMPSIGTDTNTLVTDDMFAEMRGALYTHRFEFAQNRRNSGDYPLKTMSINSREALEWATIGGAKAMCIDDRTGSLSLGKKADIIFLNGDDTNMFPVHDPVYAVVEHGTIGNVDHVMINGEFKKRDGKLLYPCDKYADLKSKVAASAERLMSEGNYRPAA